MNVRLETGGQSLHQVEITTVLSASETAANQTRLVFDPPPAEGLLRLL